MGQTLLSEKSPIDSKGETPVCIGRESNGVHAHHDVESTSERQAIRQDGDLAAVVQAWPTLPDAVKAGILATVNATKGQA